MKLSIKRATLALLIGLLMLFAVRPSHAQSQTVQVRWSGSLHAGPSSSYPILGYLPASRMLFLNGCLADYAWCDVAAGPVRGWIDANNLFLPQNGPYFDAFGHAFYVPAFPVTYFSPADYWHNFYQDQPWYANHTQWEGWSWWEYSQRWPQTPVLYQTPVYHPPVVIPPRPRPPPQPPTFLPGRRWDQGGEDWETRTQWGGKIQTQAVPSPTTPQSTP
jgi:uncharacterized protein YraI